MITESSSARTSSGISQPTTHDTLNGVYRINFIRPRIVEIQDEEPFIDEDFGDEAMTRDMDAFAERTSGFKLDVDMEMELVDGAEI
jgi:hypothetical protein